MNKRVLDAVLRAIQRVTGHELSPEDLDRTLGALLRDSGQLRLVVKMAITLLGGAFDLSLRGLKTIGDLVDALTSAWKAEEGREREGPRKRGGRERGGDAKRGRPPKRRRPRFGRETWDLGGARGPRRDPPPARDRGGDGDGDRGADEPAPRRGRGRRRGRERDEPEIRPDRDRGDRGEYPSPVRGDGDAGEAEAPAAAGADGEGEGTEGGEGTERTESAEGTSIDDPGPPPGSGAEEPDEHDEERRVQVAILHEGRRRATFVRGAPHVVRCWIGIFDADDPRARGVADERIPAAEIPSPGALLDVHLVYEHGGQAPVGQIVLPPTGDSTTCDLPVQVRTDDRFPSLEIAFLFRGRVFESVRVTAASVATADEDEEGQVIQVSVRTSRRQVQNLRDREAADVTIATHEEQVLLFSPGFGRAMPLDDLSRLFELLNRRIFVTDASLVRQLVTEGGSGEPILQHDHPEVEELLRVLARQGAQIHREIGQVATTAQRIHVVNTASRYLQPVEYVYDRGTPRRDAKLCDGWEWALSTDADTCPACGPIDPRPQPSSDRVCPLGFWGLRMIIERHDQAEGSLDASISPSDQRARLLRPTRALFGASNVVERADRDRTFRVLSTHLGDGAMDAPGWGEWRQRVADPGASLLVALPHQGFDAEYHEAFLEIGGEPLYQPELNGLFVTTATEGPGPIVLLLGCRTQAQGELGYSSMARNFLAGRASIVVGTLAQVLGRHAAPLAQELARLLLATDLGDCTFGALLRRVRRRMLLRGYLMGMSVVAVGDGDWRLGDRGGR